MWKVYFILFYLISFSSFAQSPIQNTEQLQSNQPASDCRNIPGLEISGSIFGSAKYGKNNKVIITPTRHINYKIKNSYGMRINLNNKTGQPIKVYGKLVLPKPCPSWPDSVKDFPDIIIDPSRRASHTKHPVKPGSSQVEEFWVIEKGDPTGLHTMELFYEGSTVCRFDFVIE